MTSKEAPPDVCLLVLLAITGWYVLLFLTAIVLQRPIFPLAYFGLGYDFADFHRAAQDWLAGADPYGRARFVTPPLSSLIALPLAGLEVPRAALVFLCVNIACLAAGMVLVARTFGLTGLATACLVAALFHSPSAIMLLERGNIDGLVFLLVAWLLSVRGNEIARGVALFVAAAIKVYPIVLALPLMVAKQHRLVAQAVALLALSVVVQHQAFWRFIGNQMARADNMRLPENISGLVLPWAIAGGPEAQSKLWLATGVLALAAAAVICARMDMTLWPTSDETVRNLLLTTWAAFFINFPPLVYLYSGVFVLMIAAAVAGNAARLGRALTLQLVAAIALTQFPAQSIVETAGGATSLFLLHFLPPIGALWLLWLAIAVRRHLARAAPPRLARAAPPRDTSAAPPRDTGAAPPRPT